MGEQRRPGLPEGQPIVEAIEVVEDLSAVSRCDEGFLRLKRLVCRNRRADGSVSRDYKIDLIDRNALDAVAVVLWRRAPETGRVEVLIRHNLRPAIYFRGGQKAAIMDEGDRLTLAEIVAGILEDEDLGEEGIRARAAAEALEEAGFAVRSEDVVFLGSPFFVAPGILSEKVYIAAADVGSIEPGRPSGDGSPLEEMGPLEWVDLDEVLSRCESGAIEDAKTEIGVRRLKDRLLGGGAALLATRE